MATMAVTRPQKWFPFVRTFVANLRKTMKQGGSDEASLSSLYKALFTVSDKDSCGLKPHRDLFPWVALWSSHTTSCPQNLHNAKSSSCIEIRVTKPGAAGILGALFTNLRNNGSTLTTGQAAPGRPSPGTAALSSPAY